jgi:small GTP-binding protein
VTTIDFKIKNVTVGG